MSSRHVSLLQSSSPRPTGHSNELLKAGGKHLSLRQRVKARVRHKQSTGV